MVESSKVDNTADVVQVIDLPPDALAGNDSPENATDLGGLNKAISESNLAISDPIENDFFKVYLSTAGTASDTLSLSRLDGTGHAELQIIDGSGNIVADNDPSGTLGQNLAGSGFESLSLNGLAAGEYYIRVGSADGADFKYNLNLTADPSRSGVELVNAAYLPPTELVPTLTYPVAISVANYGSQTAYNVPVQFELVGTDGGVTILNTATTIARIDPGQTVSIDVNITVPSSIAAGTYTLKFLIDPNSTIAEANKADNSATSSVTITSVPDQFAQQNRTNGFVDLGVLQSTATYNNLHLNSANDRVSYLFQTGATGTASNAITVSYDNSQGNISAILFDTQGNQITEVDSATAGR